MSSFRGSKYRCNLWQKRNIVFVPDDDLPDDPFETSQISVIPFQTNNDLNSTRMTMNTPMPANYTTTGQNYYIMEVSMNQSTAQGMNGSMVDPNATTDWWLVSTYFVTSHGTLSNLFSTTEYLSRNINWLFKYFF